LFQYNIIINMLEYPSFSMYSQIWIEHSVKMEITLCTVCYIWVLDLYTHLPLKIKKLDNFSQFR